MPDTLRQAAAPTHIAFTPGPVLPALRSRLAGLRYTPANTILAVEANVYGGPLSLLVVGCVDAVSYEWVLVRDDGTVAAHSNDGYGSTAPALRDGLIVAIGLPDNLADLRAKSAQVDGTADAALAGRFSVEGVEYSLVEMLTANADDPNLCEWVRTAKVGDRFPAVLSCVAVGA